MTDKRYKWLILAVSLTVIAVAFIYRYPDMVKAQNTTSRKLGQYVYVDCFSIIHTSRNCTRLNKFISYDMVHSNRVRIDELSAFFGYKLIGDDDFCPKCVTDNQFEKLIKETKRQREVAMSTKTSPK